MIFLRLYQINICQNKYYKPCDPGGAYWRQSALTGQGFFAKMVKMELYEILKNGGNIMESNEIL